MAKKQTEDLVTTTVPVNTALAVADGVDRNDRRGKENIEAGDKILPFLAICQKTSPQLESDHAKYIEGIKFLDLFNSASGEILEQPVEFIPIKLKKHAIEFNPFDEGGGIKDRNVRWDDPRCEFHDDEKPSATRFYDWAVLIFTGDLPQLIVLSFKSTNIGVAKLFQQLLDMRSGPSFAGKYTVRVAKATNKYGAFGKLLIQAAGKPTPAQFEFASEVYESIKDRNIVVEHEAELEPDDSPRMAMADPIPF